MFLGRDLHLPGDVFRGDPLPNGSLVGGPGTIAARVQDDISVIREVALERQQWMIARNAKYYLNKALDLRPGDLVMASYTAPAQGDQVPHRKLQVKWTGPHVVLRVVNQTMVQLGTLRGTDREYRAGDPHFLVHGSKIRLLRRKDDLAPTRPVF